MNVYIVLELTTTSVPSELSYDDGYYDDYYDYEFTETSVVAVFLNENDAMRCVEDLSCKSCTSDYLYIVEEVQESYKEEVND